jgi:hypothetical protein
MRLPKKNLSLDYTNGVIDSAETADGSGRTFAMLAATLLREMRYCQTGSEGKWHWPHHLIVFSAARRKT